MLYEAIFTATSNGSDKEPCLVKLVAGTLQA